MKNIKVINNDYNEYLKKQEDNSIDVIYLDPMFKEPIKESNSINSFRELTNKKLLNENILKEALRVCKKRVVIKERKGSNEFERLGIKDIIGRSRDGEVSYGMIKKR